MSPTKSEILTRQFYAWELLGRGWLHAEAPVELEPTFTPFFGHFISPKQFVDDGLRHTLVSKLISVFTAKPKANAADTFPEVLYELYPYTVDEPRTVFEIVFQKGQAVSLQSTQLLSMLIYCTNAISFEIVATATTITLQFTAHRSDARYVYSQLSMYCKGVSIRQKEADEQSLVSPIQPFATVDFGLREEYTRPLSGQPQGILPGLFSLMSTLEGEEKMIYQVLFNGVVNPWQGSIIKAVSDTKGGSFFANAPEMLPLAKEKISAPLCTATVRLITQSHSVDAAMTLLQPLSFALTTNTKSPANSLTPLTDDSYPAQERAEDIICRESHRAGMIVNIKELSALVQLPDTNVLHPKCYSGSRKTKEAPSGSGIHSTSLGVNVHNGQSVEVSQSPELRVLHTHVIGATGAGKSTLLHSMICQDIANGEGLAVFDPQGDLIDSILSCIPKERMADVILIDPADAEYPVGCNIIKAHSDIEKEVLASDLVASFKRFSTSWGDQMNAVLSNAVLALLESPKEQTLFDLRRFLVEKAFRESVLADITDPTIRYYWQKEYPLLKTNSIGPILTRLDSFLRPRSIRNMVAQTKSIDFDRALNEKKILLIKLSQGLIGTENSYLLGSFLVSKIHQTALARQRQSTRTPFYVYIDEFHQFITPSLSEIITGARKYQLGLILAHQDLQQVQRADAELLHSILSNCGTRVCFRLGDADAKRMAEGFAHFEATDLQNLKRGEAIMRFERPEQDFSLDTTVFEKEDKQYTAIADVIAHSRQAYAVKREDVEGYLLKTLSLEPVKEPQREILHQPQEPKKKIKEEYIAPVVSQQEQEILKQETIRKKQITQHRYIQQLIKKVAESKGWKATIEMQVQHNTGAIDVVLEKQHAAIAVEVSHTTDANWELHNIQKCIAAGYQNIFVCVMEAEAKEKLELILKEAALNTTGTAIKIGYAEELFALLEPPKETPAQPPSTEMTMKGYRVKVEYDDLSTEAALKKEQSIAAILQQAMKKPKQK